MAGIKELEQIMSKTGMRPTVISIPEAIFDMAKESADELHIEVSSWVSAAIQIMSSGQKDSHEVKVVLTKQGAVIDLANSITSAIISESEKEE